MSLRVLRRGSVEIPKQHLHDLLGKSRQVQVSQLTSEQALDV